MDRKEFEMVTMNLIAVYAGEAWANGQFPLGSFGADAIHKLYDYAELAKTIEMPLTEDGLVDTEVWREDVYQTVQNYIKDSYSEDELE